LKKIGKHIPKFFFQGKKIIEKHVSEYLFKSNKGKLEGIKET
jgi:hypothetical protein